MGFGRIARETWIRQEAPIEIHASRIKFYPLLQFTGDSGFDDADWVKREEKEAPGVAMSRAQFDALAIPVWSGQISQRAGFLGSLAAGASAGEIDGDSACKSEIARLWSAVERSVEGGHGTGVGVRGRIGGGAFHGWTSFY